VTAFICRIHDAVGGTHDPSQNAGYAFAPAAPGTAE
jgi:hypothetical protein